MKKMAIVYLVLLTVLMLCSAASARNKDFHNYPTFLVIISKNNPWAVTGLSCSKGDDVSYGMPVLTTEYPVDCELTGCDCTVTFQWSEQQRYINAIQPNMDTVPPSIQYSKMRVVSPCALISGSVYGEVTVTHLEGERLEYKTFPCGGSDKKYSPGFMIITEREK